MNSMPKEIHYVFSVREAVEEIYRETQHLMDDSEFARGVAVLLVASLIEPDDCRGSVDSHFERAVNVFFPIGLDHEEAARICRTAGELIILAITDLIPDFKHDKYEGKYSYAFRNDYDVQLTIDTDVFREPDGPVWEPDPGSSDRAGTPHLSGSLTQLTDIEGRALLPSGVVSPGESPY